MSYLNVCNANRVLEQCFIRVQMAETEPTKIIMIVIIDETFLFSSTNIFLKFQEFETKALPVMMFMKIYIYVEAERACIMVPPIPCSVS